MSLISELCAAYDVLVYNKKSAPPFHTLRHAGVEIFLDINGGFITAKMPTDKAQIIIPSTENAENRTCGIAPFPLSDTLRYIAADYPDESGNAVTAYFAAYEKQLSEWVDSPYTCAELAAVLAYVRKKHVFRDLCDCGTVSSADKATSQMMVSFTVDGIRLCKCEKIHSLFIAFSESRNEKRAYSYVSGKVLSRAEKFPSRLLSPFDRAKLISANDSFGFTYRGRFCNKSQAFSIGTQESHKAHEALRFLCANAAFTLENAKYLMWRTDGKMPQNFFTDELSPEEFSPSETVIVKVEPTTTGRLAARFFSKGDLSGICCWLESCSWRLNGKTKTPPLSSFQRLGGGDTLDILLSCALERRVVPESTVRRVCRAVMRTDGFSCRSEYYRALEAACALVVQHRLDCGKSSISPVLSETENDRSYLFGRIFAYLMFAEKKSPSRGRKTLCETYFSAFAARPAHTLAILRKMLSRAVSAAVGRIHPLDEINHLVRTINAADFSDEPLDFTVLCGLYCQLDALGEVKCST